MARIRIHDPFQLELKYDFPLRAASAGAVHILEMWVYLPPQLGIDEPVFHRADFYRDLTAYVRFQTPKRSFTALMEQPDSPLAWLERNEARLSSGVAGADDVDAAVYQLRLFAAECRALLRDEARALALRPDAPVGVVADMGSAAQRFVQSSQDMLSRYRTLRRRFIGGRTPAQVQGALLAVEDFVSIQSLESWYNLLNNHAINGTAACLRDAITSETAVRAAAGLQGALDPADELSNERFVTRMNLLKKWVLGVLHLRLVNSHRAEQVQDLAFGIAAAAAMFVAVILQLVAAWTVGMPTMGSSGFTLAAFVATAVTGYILKDRLKDRLKAWFTARIPRWLHDRRQDLMGEDSRLGAVEETVRLVRPHEAPIDVERLRAAHEDPLFTDERRREDVIHYRRRLTLTAGRAPGTMTAVDEILRFSVLAWLRRMDEPTRGLSQLQPDGSVARIKARKTYRAHVVLRIGNELERYCVVLTRKGVVRIER